MHEPDLTRPSPSPIDRPPAVAEQLVVGVALAQQAARAAVVTRPGATPAPRRDGHGGRSRVMVRQRRGVVLVFVVVLLTLLGIMGTAYLASSRLDRQSIIGRGSLTGTQTALLRDPRKLDEVAAGVERAVKIKLIRDLFNIGPGYKFDTTATNQGAFALQAYAGFRQPFQQIVDPDATTTMVPSRWYHDMDAPGRSDPYLASLLAIHPTNTAGDYRWGFIGAPLGEFGVPDQMFIDPYFADPRYWTASNSAAVPAQRYATQHHTNVFFEGWNPTGVTPAPDDRAVLERQNVVITSQTLVRPATATNVAWDNTRTYPALQPMLGGALANTPLIAGDADGDGIADGGLMPVEINLSNLVNDPATSTVDPPRNATLARYLDTANNVIYYASYRVVDNSAKLNLNTALDKRGELVNLNIAASANENSDTTGYSELRNFLGDNLSIGTAGGIPQDFTGRPGAAADGTYGPNYGFFRSNVGLLDVIRRLISPINQATDTNDNNRVPAQQELRRLVDARFPLLKQSPGGGYVQNAATDVKDIQRLAVAFQDSAVAQFRYGTFFQTQDPAPNSAIGYGAMTPNQFYQFRSFGDLLEQQVARRPFSPGGYLWSTSATAASLSNGLVSLGGGDAASLAAKGGSLVNDLLSPGTAESALMFSLRMSAPNVNNNGDMPWGYFPPNAVDLWYGWTQDFNAANGWTIGNPLPPSITAIEDPTIGNRAYTYSAANAGAATSPLAGTGFGLPGKPAGTADVVLPRSPRALFTTYNGVTNTAPERGDVDVNLVTPGTYAEPGAYRGPTPGVPIGMPAYNAGTVRTGPTAGGGNNQYIRHSALGTDPSLAGVSFSYPAQKVSAATGTKEQLWRAFWSAMTQQHFFRYLNTANRVAYSSYWDVKEPLVYPVPLAGAADPEQTYNTFRSSDRWESIENSVVAGRSYLPSPVGGAPPSQAGVSPSINTPYERSIKPDQVLSTRQMALLRSAVAACNTIDLRDNDNDITAMDVDLTDDNDVIASAATPRYYARVYGTEKQLVITGVFLQSTGAGYAAVEIYNPTDVPIRLSAYRLSVVNRARAIIGTPNPLLDGSIERTNPTGVGGPTNTTIALSTDVGQTLAPGGYVVISSLPVPPAGVTLPPESAHAPPPTGSPEVYVITPATPNQGNAANLTAALALNALRTSELVLCRTRRADGEAFTDQTAINATTAGNGVREKIENELLDADRLNGEVGTDVTTLVPVDAVDCRFLTAGSASGRFSYTRTRPTLDATLPSPVGPYGAALTPLTGAGTGERAGAWRCFYAGQFYPLREPNGTARNPATGIAAWAADADDNYAWQELNAGVAVTMGDPTLTYDWVGVRGPTEQNGLRAPVIPIQNFAPYDPFSETNRRTFVAPVATPGVPDDSVRVYGNTPTNNAYNAMITATPATRGLFHLINEFPYGSPIARDMDLMAIPYIGTYKIYRTTGPALADTVLYDYVPLSMDAVAVAPKASDVYDPATPAAQIKTVGRFDPRLNLDTAAYTVPISQLLNNWAADLTDYVTARRQQRRTFFPDVPSVSPSTTFLTSGVAGNPNPQNTVAYLAKDQRYAQDGPVLGTSNTFNLVNDFNDTGYVSFTERSGSDPTLLGVNRTGLRAGYEYTGLNSDTTLVQGVINLNTAPQVVLRELPWYVSPVTGQTDFTLGDANSTTLLNQTKIIVGTVQERREALAAPVATFDPKTAATVRTWFGFDSLQRVAEEETAGTLKTAPTIASANAPTAEELMRIGVLNPINRMEGQANYEYGNANLNRLSNLTSTRSDVFTVYVTVQAWTWAPGLGGNQQTDTRLVGERRSSFIVDRSKITGSNFDVSDLITLPIERE